MKIQYVVITIFMLIFVSCIPYDDDTCRLPIFSSKTYLEFSSKLENLNKINGLTIELKATSGAELSNIDIKASFPTEVHVEKAFSIYGDSVLETNGFVINAEKNVVSYPYSRIIKADRIICAINIDSLSNQWSKPIEIDISLDFKQIIKCSSGGMKDGRYTKKTTLIINPKDGKFYEREGRTEEDWVYHGK